MVFVPAYLLIERPANGYSGLQMLPSAYTKASYHFVCLSSKHETQRVRHARPWILTSHSLSSYNDFWPVLVLLSSKQFLSDRIYSNFIKINLIFSSFSTNVNSFKRNFIICNVDLTHFRLAIINGPCAICILNYQLEGCFLFYFVNCILKLILFSQFLVYLISFILPTERHALVYWV